MTKTMVQRTKRANKKARFFVCKRSEFKALFQGFHCFGSILGSEGVMKIIPPSPLNKSNHVPLLRDFLFERMPDSSSFKGMSENKKRPDTKQGAYLFKQS